MIEQVGVKKVAIKVKAKKDETKITADEPILGLAAMAPGRK